MNKSIKDKLEVRQIILFISFVFFSSNVINAQQVIGTKGMLNIPTAEMNKSGTFIGGISLVQNELLPAEFTYNTGVYYINFTIFSFLEFTFRETLLKTQKGDKKGFYQQDRSTSFRLRALKENRYLPSIVLGVNDPYADHGRSYYASAYGVVSKKFLLKKIGTIGLTAGYFKAFNDGEVYNGPFGGIRYTPQGIEFLDIMAEYDSNGFNFGVSMQFFRHLNLLCFTREFTGVCAGISYQYTIKY